MQSEHFPQCAQTKSIFLYLKSSLYTFDGAHFAAESIYCRILIMLIIERLIRDFQLN